MVLDDAVAEALATELARIRGLSVEDAIRISVLHARREIEMAPITSSRQN
jgi:hypothetical protein